MCSVGIIVIKFNLFAWAYWKGSELQWLLHYFTSYTVHYFNHKSNYFV